MSNLILTFLVNALLQVPLIALVAALAVRLLRKAPARQQHMVWAAALVVGLLLPAMSLIPRKIEPSAIPIDPVGSAAIATAQTSTFSLDALIERTQQPAARGFTAAQLIALGFGAFLLYRAVALVAAWRRTRRIIRGATMDVTAIVQARCGVIAGVGPVLSSDAIATPMTVGAMAPVIIIPAALLDDLSDAALLALVGHEAAHIRRRDFLINLALEILALPISFHPVTWMLRRRVAFSRELACDEHVTPALVAPRAYARALVDVASFASGAHGPMMSLTMAGSDFEHRILRIVRRPTMKTSRTLLAIAWTAFAFAAAAATGIAVHPAFPSHDAQPLSEAAVEVEPGDFASRDAQARAAAACTAGRKREVAAIPRLLDMLSDDTPIRPMRCYGGDWSPALQTFERPSPGEQAALALASISKPAVDALTQALDSRSPSARRNAAWAIGEVRGGRSLDRDSALIPLMRLLSDEDATVRRAAVFGLSELKDNAAVEPLLTTLGDADASVRGMVVFALGEIRDGRATPALAQTVLADHDPEVRRGAAWALGEIADRRAVSALNAALNDPYVRASAERALGEIEGD